MTTKTASLRSDRARRRSRDSSDSARDFGSNVGAQLALIYHGRHCWVCKAQFQIEKAHVFPKMDISLFALKADGLLGLKARNEASNAIHLCKCCHGAWDDMYNPLLLIVPTYLHYFVAIEKQWQDACMSSDAAAAAPRMAPSAETYFDYCHTLDQRSDGIPDHGRGGLYTAYIVENYFPLPDRLDKRGWHDHWHGDPSAMIRRAIIAATKIRVPEAPPEGLRATLRQLKELDILYEAGNEMWEGILNQQQASDRAPPPPPPPSTQGPDSAPPDVHPPHPPHPPPNSSAGAPPFSSAMGPPPFSTTAPGRSHRLPSPSLTPSPHNRKRRRQTMPDTQCKRVRVEAPEEVPGIKFEAGYTRGYESEDPAKAGIPCGASVAVSEPALARLKNEELVFDQDRSITCVRRWLGQLEQPMGACLGWLNRAPQSSNDSLSIHTHAQSDDQEYTAYRRRRRYWEYGPGTTAEDAMTRRALLYVR
ncbi:hypothetical protein BU26DRAFT_565985 [Trematosphaeria pertusa]|uniref:HNH nuclease domain-containing protein n=1 Tax=Trematosphaeria pertusa TaxID=390896 RepID=A0A6A6IFC2_9PLEO|nr:uncharacterized protein BU26DRAFT_565985 [Trematosphaeria pertusa]KAF2248602.1 hypothetical protein BU26DRAFT_565985 [Trematosphaeria pertusa]